MITIYVCHLGESEIVSSSILKPIQVGKACGRPALNMLGDDTGDNISIRNSSYCELTAIYWAWKNDRTSDYIGFSHYRRYFDFNPDRDRVGGPDGLLRTPAIDEKFLEEYGLNDANMASHIEGYDAIVSEPADLAKIAFRDLRQQYEQSDDHFVNDLDLAGRVLEQLHPSYKHSFDRAMSGQIFYTNLMFIFNRALFDRFNDWIFAILKELENQIPVVGRNPQARRAIGYVSERLLTVFLLHEMQRPDFKIKHLRRVLVLDTTPSPKPPSLPITNLQILTVGASSDDAFSPHLAALIASVLSNADKNRFIDFIVLDGGISTESWNELRRLEKLHPHCLISSVNMKGLDLGAKSHPIFSPISFYRVAVASILFNREKIVFLDTDVIVLTDISELYDIALNNNFVAAVPDLAMRALTALKIRSLLQAGGQPAARYLTDTLAMGPHYSDYFQAGVMVMNLTGLRSEGIDKQMIADIKARLYWFVDQDVLNKHLVGRVLFLDNAYNAVFFDDFHQNALSNEDRLRYFKSTNDPKIVHYAGPSKPWITPYHPAGKIYWHYARLTGWYELLLSHFVNQVVTAHTPQRQDIAYRIARACWRMIPLNIRIILRPRADWLRRAISKSP